jgi:hypothetical protein
MAPRHLSKPNMSDLPHVIPAQAGIQPTVLGDASR